MMILILAAGYLFTVYLLLALAKRSRKKSSPRTKSQKSVDRDNQDSQKRIIKSNVI
jgi:uncharacterized membrane protein affecting hemolysin expression